MSLEFPADIYSNTLNSYRGETSYRDLDLN